MSVPVELQGVEETLLIPLWARAAETERPDGLVRDPRAVAMRDRIAYDFSRFKGDPGIVAGVAVRTAILDAAVTDFLAAHPGAVVLNLAAGLDTRFFRVGAPASAWWEVDLPNPMRLRRQLFDPSDRHRFLAASVTEPGWAEALDVPMGVPVLAVVEGLSMYLDAPQLRSLLAELSRRFPGATVLVELFGPLATLTTRWVPAVARTQARFKGGFDAASAASLLPGTRVERVWYMLREHPARWGAWALFRALPVVGTQYQIAKLRLP